MTTKIKKPTIKITIKNRPSQEALDSFAKELIKQIKEKERCR